jgi:hypothetical protein
LGLHIAALAIAAHQGLDRVALTNVVDARATPLRVAYTGTLK